MKNSTLLTLALTISTFVFGQYNVTFQVDMNQYSGNFTTPEVNGTFNSWCGNCNAMSDANSDGIWDVTVSITADSIEYKFAHDNWSGQESLNSSQSCTKTSGGFTNRFIYLNGDTTLPAVCWESCIECGTPPDTSNVTFRVDMREYTGTFTTPEVNGTFNNWCGNCNPMTDTDGDSIWEVTLPLTADSIEYKFSHDAWSGQEELTPNSGCTKTSGVFTNRFLTLNGDIVLDPVCWGSCEVCPPDSADVTFMVDMSDYTGSFTTPEVNGTFNAWCGSCNPMSDDDTNNIWQVTLRLPQDTIEYKFSHDNWTGQEELTEGDTCTTTNFGFTNRLLAITGDTTLIAVCWESCDICPADTDTALGTTNIVNVAGMKVYPNPARQIINVKFSNIETETAMIEVVNLLGETVMTHQVTTASATSIDVSDLKNGMYMIRTHGDSGVLVRRFMISQ